MPPRAPGGQGALVLAWHVTAGEAQDTHIFICDRDYEVLEVREVHRVVGAASSTAMVRKCTSGTAPASGTALLSAELALDSTVDVPLVGTLVSSRTTRQVPRGSTIAIDFTGTVSAYEGVVQVVLQPVRKNTRY